MTGQYVLGWFGIPGAPERFSTKTHIVKDGRPVCGARLGPTQEFQWCSPMGGYVPECRRCAQIEALLKRKCSVCGTIF